MSKEQREMIDAMVVQPRPGGPSAPEHTRPHDATAALEGERA
jgi:hypothetical protein